MLSVGRLQSWTLRRRCDASTVGYPPPFLLPQVDARLTELEIYSNRGSDLRNARIDQFFSGCDCEPLYSSSQLSHPRYHAYIISIYIYRCICDFLSILQVLTVKIARRAPKIQSRLLTSDRVITRFPVQLWSLTSTVTRAMLFASYQLQRTANRQPLWTRTAFTRWGR